MMTEGDQTLGGEHTLQHTDNILQNCMLETQYNVINQCHPDKFNLIKNSHVTFVYFHEQILLSFEKLKSKHKPGYVRYSTTISVTIR